MPCSRRCLVAGVCAGPLGWLAAADSGARLSAETEQTDQLTRVDTSTMPEGEIKVVQWRGRPVWVLRRSPQMIDALELSSLHARLADPKSERGDPLSTPSYARNNLRSIKPEVFVGVAVCPHAGCQPVPRIRPGPNPERADNWPGGFACQCHFATFDLSGRVFRDKPTSENISVPRHMYASEAILVIGRDADGEA